MEKNYYLSATEEYLADISKATNLLLEEYQGFSNTTCGDYPQTPLQLMLQAYYNCNDMYCNTCSSIISCLLSADLRPVSEIMADASKMHQAYDKEAESELISGLIGRLLLKELQ